MDKKEPEYVFLTSIFHLGKINKNGDVYTFENFSVLPSSIVFEHKTPKEDYQRYLDGQLKFIGSMECRYNA